MTLVEEESEEEVVVNVGILSVWERGGSGAQTQARPTAIGRAVTAAGVMCGSCQGPYTMKVMAEIAAIG